MTNICLCPNNQTLSSSLGNKILHIYILTSIFGGDITAGAAQSTSGPELLEGSGFQLIKMQLRESSPLISNFNTMGDYYQAYIS